MATNTKTIALFGGTGSTGSNFLKLALDGGYTVRALVRTPSKVSIKDNDKLTLVEGSITDADKVEEVIKGCDYAVSMLGLMGNMKGYPQDMMLNFVKLSQPLMAAAGTKVFLYQAGNLCPAPGEKKSMTVKILRNTYGRMTGLEKALKDHDNVISFLSKEVTEKKGDEKKMNIIVTRPPGMMEGASQGKAKVVTVASASSIPYVDVAQFSFDALEDEALYGTYPMIGF